MPGLVLVKNSSKTFRDHLQPVPKLVILLTLPLNLLSILINFVYNRIVSAYENKVLVNPGSTRIFSDLVNKHQDISFVSFVQYVLQSAADKRCFDTSSSCAINYHFR